MWGAVMRLRSIIASICWWIDKHNFVFQQDEQETRLLSFTAMSWSHRLVSYLERFSHGFGCSLAFKLLLEWQLAMLLLYRDIIQKKLALSVRHHDIKSVVSLTRRFCCCKDQRAQTCFVFYTQVWFTRQINLFIRNIVSVCRRTAKANGSSLIALFVW